MSKWKILITLSAALLLGLMGIYYFASLNMGETDIAGKGGYVYALSNPSSEITGGAKTFLEQEAGISIYTNIGAPLNLAKAKTAYKTIERETSDYIVGSVSLPDMPESDDAHCFVHKDGWIVVYYFKDNKITSMIFDWRYFSNGVFNKTKLQLGLEKISLAIGVTLSKLTYWHFQYPDANKLMIITKTYGSFRFMIPSNLTIYEITWTQSSDYYSDFRLDGKDITINLPRGNQKYGTLGELSRDQWHTAEVTNGRIAILILYKEP